MDPTPVDRCVCFKATFAELIRLRAETGAGFEELQKRTGCGRGCGLCVPYVMAALATGRARLPVLPDAQLKAIIEGR
ncbi:MAG: (2Fe-2S)-binding protein [Phycisphaerales bacterium]